MTDPDIKKLVDFRKKLHQHPDLSGKEELTASLVVDFLNTTKPSFILENLGGSGIAAVYDSGKPGPSIGFRCELDALPIQENNTFEHASSKSGVSHKCGHDGHMAIVAGLGLKASNQPLKKGKLMLLFQPAEETGQGAELMLQDERLRQQLPERLYALHNIPGAAVGKILSRKGIVCPASEGLVFYFKGKTSHAGQPDKGNNPAPVISALQLRAQEMHDKNVGGPDRTKITTVLIKLGERAFGVNPGEGSIGFTLRSDKDEALEACKKALIAFAEKEARTAGLQLKFETSDPFKAVVNADESYSALMGAAGILGYQSEEMTTPFSWSEDFGRFSDVVPTGFFGLGAGENMPELHHDTYDFPDGLIPVGLNMFCELANELWQ